MGLLSEPLFNRFGISTDIVVVGVMAFGLLLLLIIIAQNIKLKRLTKKYKMFMADADGMSLENIMYNQKKDIIKLKDQLVYQKELLSEYEDKFGDTYSKIGIVKYDAFREMGGKLSFSVAILNEKNSGFIMNSIHNREGCYTYIKEIVKGDSYIQLTDEEKEALNNAINIRNYML